MGIEVLIGAAIVSTAASAVYQNEAADATRDAARARKKQEDLKFRRGQLQQIRNARMAHSAATLAGEAQGASRKDSGRQGGESSILSQLGSNLGFSVNMQKLSDQAAEEMGKASRFQGLSSIFGTAASLAMTGANFQAGKTSPAPASSQPTVSSIFGPMSETQF